MILVSPPAWSKVNSGSPVPEYAPTPAMLISADLFAADYHAPALVTALAAAGAEVVIATNAPQTRGELAKVLRGLGVPAPAIAHTTSWYLPHGNIWMRDYSPLLIYEHGPHFFRFLYDDPGSTLNNQFPITLAAAFKVPLESAPFALDGGNFLTNGDFCFTSTQDLRISKDASLERYFAQLGCRETVVIEHAPHAHLDMWVKIVNPHQVLVNELDEKTLEVARRLYGHLPLELENLRDTLNRKAAELSRTMQVRRLPMPLPYRGAFRTYTNAVLVNHHAIVPSYQRFGWNYDDYPDAELKSFYEKRVRRTYEDLGFHVDQINADGLIYNGGAWRCVTAPLFAIEATRHTDKKRQTDSSFQKIPDTDPDNGKKGP